MLYDPKWEVQTETRPHVRILIEARKLLEHPDNWAAGDDVSFSDARQMCVGLAMQKAYRDSNCREPDIINAAMLFERANDIAGRSIVDWNDAPGRTHAEVLAAFDRAIAAS